MEIEWSPHKEKSKEWLDRVVILVLGLPSLWKRIEKILFSSRNSVSNNSTESHTRRQAYFFHQTVQSVDTIQEERMVKRCVTWSKMLAKALYIWMSPDTYRSHDTITHKVAVIFRQGSSKCMEHRSKVLLNCGWPAIHNMSTSCLFPLIDVRIMLAASCERSFISLLSHTLFILWLISRLKACRVLLVDSLLISSSYRMLKFMLLVQTVLIQIE